MRHTSRGETPEDRPHPAMQRDELIVSLHGFIGYIHFWHSHGIFRVMVDPGVK
jgi:hypothetical protein